MKPMTDPTPPSPPPMPSSGGAVYHELMKMTDPRFGLTGLTEGIDERSWHDFPEAASKYATLATGVIDSLAAAVHAFGRQAGSYMENLSRNAEGNTLNSLEQRIQAAE
jgi:hypothetical protein